jgi:hypothetical protein
VSTTPTILAEPILVANLPLCPEDAHLFDVYVRSHGLSRRERASVTENFKLRCNYAGHYIIATTGPKGMQIHAIDLEDPGQVDDLTKRLRAQGYHNISHFFPDPVADSQSWC